MCCRTEMIVGEAGRSNIKGSRPLEHEGAESGRPGVG